MEKITLYANDKPAEIIIKGTPKEIIDSLFEMKNRHERVSLDEEDVRKIAEEIITSIGRAIEAARAKA